MKKCLQCNNDFIPKRKDSRFCSAHCLGRFYYIRKIEKNIIKTRNCLRCGKEFKTTTSQKHCSVKCWHKPKMVKICPTCKHEFFPKHSKIKFCSFKCFSNFYAPNSENAKRRYEEIKASRRIIKKQIVCIHCKKEFIGYTHQKYCSHTCKQSYQKILYRLRFGNINHSKKGRPIKLKEFKKDFCEICKFSNKLALQCHHLQPGTTGKKGGYMILCANCHSILHGKIGFGKSVSLTKDDVKNLLIDNMKEKPLILDNSRNLQCLLN